MLKPGLGTICATLAIALVTACGGQPASPSVAAPTAAPQPTAAPAATQTSAATQAPAATDTAAVSGAIEGPRFTHPTEITNPFYPVSLIGQAISLGTEGGQPFRTEVTLLLDTRTITWEGQQIEVRVSQYVAYADDNLVEVAYDYFAQADDGSVYYLGEEVSNYQDGKVANHEGSWQAGKDGAPAALIMPAHPAVGQVFNPENLPGVVYETDEIVSLTEKSATPAGPIDNGLLIKETLMDGSIEYKVNAADFGIIESRAQDEQVKLVWLNRTDVKPGMVPGPLSTIEAEAEDIMDVVPGGDWPEMSTAVTTLSQAWEAYQAQAANDKVPPPFLEAFKTALEDLQSATVSESKADTLEAANDLSAAVVDLFTVYGPATPTDLGRLDVLGRQLVLEVAAGDLTAAADNLAKTNAVWARLKPVVVARNGSAVAAQFDNSLATQQAALNKEDRSALTSEANNGLELVDALERLF